jgi:hypothetical protein
MSALTNASAQQQQPQGASRRPQSTILDQNQSQQNISFKGPQQQMMPNPRQSAQINSSFQQQQQSQTQQPPAPKFGFNR